MFLERFYALRYRAITQNSVQNFIYSIRYLYIAIAITKHNSIVNKYKCKDTVDYIYNIFQFATVYKARDIETNKIVAVKKVSVLQNI